MLSHVIHSPAYIIKTIIKHAMWSEKRFYLFLPLTSYATTNLSLKLILLFVISTP